MSSGITTESKREGIRYARLLIQELLDDPRFFEALFDDVVMDRDRLETAWDALGEAERIVGSSHPMYSPKQTRATRSHFCRRWRA